MIVPTMSLDEVVKQFQGDYMDLLAKRKYLQPKFETLVKRSRLFPVRAQYEYVSHTNHNRYIYLYSADKRGEWNMPHCNVVGIYDRPEGRYAVTSTNAGRTYIIYPPHFFSRFRERILHDENIHGDELIKRFFRVNDRFIKEPLSEEHTRAYRKYESEEGVFQAARCTEGNLFLEIRSASVIIMKTILSDEMLYENQKAAFERMSSRLEEVQDIRFRSFSSPDDKPSF